MLLVLAWLLGLTLALQHRFAHAAESGVGHDQHEPHLVGGPHSGDDGSCRLVDQAGLGEALPSAQALLVAPEACSRRALQLPVPRLVAAPWRAYEARAPPRG